MQELILGPVAIWFGLPAVIGTAFFALRLAMMLVGGADAHGGHLDVSDVHSVGDSGADPGDSTHAFKILSVQVMAAFLMGFGWGGLGALRGGGWSVSISLAFAVASGGGMVWLLGKLLKFVYGLQSSGTVPMYHALESEGTVYAQIPASSGGTGRIRVVVGDRERYYKAVTEGDALPRDTKIRVIGINDDDNSVTVVQA